MLLEVTELTLNPFPFPLGVIVCMMVIILFCVAPVAIVLTEAAALAVGGVVVLLWTCDKVLPPADELTAMAWPTANPDNATAMMANLPMRRPPFLGCQCRSRTGGCISVDVGRPAGGCLLMRCNSLLRDRQCHHNNSRSLSSTGPAPNEKLLR